jgi:hypothetical protein
VLATGRFPNLMSKLTNHMLLQKKAIPCIIQQSTAVHDKFADILSAVWKTIYYESMKNIWDGILSDPVMDYCDVWSQRNCHLNQPSTIISVTTDNIKAQDSHEMPSKVFSLRLNAFFLDRMV